MILIIVKNQPVFLSKNRFEFSQINDLTDFDHICVKDRYYGFGSFKFC